METKDIILLAACFLLAGFSLYRKYAKKSGNKDGKPKPTESFNQFSSPSKEDDYEPYSGNKK